MMPHLPSSSLALRSTGFVGLALLLLLGIVAWISFEPITVTERPLASNLSLVSSNGDSPNAGTNSAFLPAHEAAVFDPHPFDVSLSLKPNRDPRPVELPPLLPANIPNVDPASMWGRITLGQVQWQYPNWPVRLKRLLQRARFALTGVELKLPKASSLDTVVTFYGDSRFGSDHAFTAYFAPGLEPSMYSIQPLTRTNATGVENLPATLDRLLAANGLRVIHRSRHLIFVVPNTWTNPIPELTAPE